MSTRPVGLPDFEDPPVVEVALSVQFERLEALKTAHLGVLWAEFRENFPKTEEQPPLDPVIEPFGVSIPPRIGVRVETFLAPPVPRIWFLNEAATELIQVQTDRFMHNWRKTGKGTAYPRYESIRGSFERELQTFSRYVSREKLGGLRFNQCEVTYVNHIIAGQGWDQHGHLSRIVNLWSAGGSSSLLPEPEDVRFRTRYVLRDADNKPIGRLHVDVQPAWMRSDNKPMYILTLTARGGPRSADVAGVFEFLDVGRIWIVESFAYLTTPEMWRVWRRIDVK